MVSSPNLYNREDNLKKNNTDFYFYIISWIVFKKFITNVIINIGGH